MSDQYGNQLPSPDTNPLEQHTSGATTPSPSEVRPTVSDVSLGPGWWLASDGKWYAPELAPPTPGPGQNPTSTPAASSKSTSLKAGFHTGLRALESSGIVKVDRKSGKVKVKKFGVAKAALRPTKTIKRAIGGATADLVKMDQPPNAPEQAAAEEGRPTRGHDE